MIYAHSKVNTDRLLKQTKKAALHSHPHFPHLFCVLQSSYWLLSITFGDYILISKYYACTAGFFFFFLDKSV